MISPKTDTQRYLSKIAKELKKPRKTDLAEILNISPTLLSLYLAGHREPGLETCRTMIASLEKIGIQAALENFRSEKKRKKAH